MKLKNITGLQPVEEKIYLAVLSGGRLSQSDIAQKTKLNRTSLTPYIQNLLRSDILKKVIKGKRILYSANNPNKLFNQAQKKLRSLEALLPELVETYKSVSKKPNITLREGPEGLYQVSLEAAEQAHVLKSFSSPVNFLSVLTRADANRIIRVIEKRNIKALSLTSRTDKNIELMHSFKSPNLETRAMPPGITYPMEFLVYNQTTVITSWQHQFSVVIESADIAAFVESLFDYFWKLRG